MAVLPGRPLIRDRERSFPPLKPSVLLLVAALLLVLALHSQDLHVATGVINVEVPVRVFDGDRFVDDLALSDFELFEDGRPQKIIAFYFVRRTSVEKGEAGAPQAEAAAPPAVPQAAGKPTPKTVRTIVLQFEVLEPDPKIDQALDYFFNEVVQPDDSVTVVTPRGSYHLKPEALAEAPRAEIAKKFRRKLRSDILAGAADYRRMLGTLRDIDLMPLDTDQKLERTGEIVRQLRDRLGINRRSLRQLAQGLKKLEGQKYVFLFYQRELVPLPSYGQFGDESLDSAEASLSDASDADAYRTSEVTPKQIKQIFSDASVTANLIYLTQSHVAWVSTAAGSDVEQQLAGGSAQGANLGGTRLKDMSASIFSSLGEVAKATGGISESSTNPFASFRRAVAATENYYLLYYVPADYRADGKFREITVKVKGKGYRVSNRAGYFAN
jgi:VWFA-related protein